MRSRRIIIGAASSVSACWGLEGPCRPITKYRTHAGRAISGKGESQRYILRRFLCLKPPCYQSLSSSNIFTLFIRQHQTEVKRCITLTGQFWLEWVGRNKIQLNSRAAEGRQRLAAPWIIVLTNWLVVAWWALGTHVPSGYCPSAHLIIWAAGSQMSHGIAFTTHQWQVSQLFGADYLVISWVADYRYNPIPRRELSLQILTKGNPIQSQEVSYLWISMQILTTVL